MSLGKDLLQARLNQACETLIARLCAIYDETMDQIVMDACERLFAPAPEPTPAIRKRRGRPPTYARLTRDPMGGFEMTLPDGQVWHATRARDLRRKARQRGVAWQE